MLQDEQLCPFPAFNLPHVARTKIKVNATCNVVPHDQQIDQTQTHFGEGGQMWSWTQTRAWLWTQTHTHQRSPQKRRVVLEETASKIFQRQKVCKFRCDIPNPFCKHSHNFGSWGVCRLVDADSTGVLTSVSPTSAHKI